MQIMRDPRYSSELRIAAAGSVQNILDTSTLAISTAMGQETISAVLSAVQVWHDLMFVALRARQGQTGRPQQSMRVR